ncbi:MAG: hypothetical protein ACT4P0_02185 [Panacagrimonas sp.]
MSRNWADGLRPSLSLDLRSLAVLRAGLGLTLLVDALNQLGSATLLYGDAGLLPRGDAVALLETGQWSLHLVNGSTLYVALLCLIQALAAGALCLGWRTRAATLICWLLAVSATARNPLAATPGDAYAIALLTWGLLLPWGARWSVDGALRRDTSAGEAHFSAAGAAMLLQVLALPLLGALLEARPGNATALAEIAPHPLLGTLLVCLMGAIAPLALVPVEHALPRRLALLGYLCVAPTAFVVGSPGTLPWLGLLSAAVLIDPGLWAQLSPRRDLRVYVGREDAGTPLGLRILLEFLCLPADSVRALQESPRAARITQNEVRLLVIDEQDAAHLDGDALRIILKSSPLLRPLRWIAAHPALAPAHARLLKILLSPGSAQGTTVEARGCEAMGSRSRALQCGVAVVGVLSLCWQLAATGALPPAVQGLAAIPLQPLGLARSWTWFERGPQRDEQWLVVAAERIDGQFIDAFAPPAEASPGGPRFDASQPPLLDGLRGRYYELRLADPANAHARAALARRACTRHGGSLTRVRLVLMVRAPGHAGAEQRVLARYECASLQSIAEP